MKLYWSPQTRSSRAVWMLEEAGVDYEIEVIDIRDPDKPDNPEFRVASPMGKVPAIVDGDVAMSESAAICLYVADRYGAGNLAPAVDDALRGKFLYWLMYTPAVIEPAMGEKINNIEPNRGRNGWGDFDSMITTLKDGLGDQQWILGDHFTAADVMLGSSVNFLQMFNMLAECPRLENYAERCRARPAFIKAQERES